MYLRRVFSDEDTLYSVEDAVFRDLTPDPKEWDLRGVLLRQAKNPQAVCKAQAAVDKERAWQVMQLSATLAGSKALTKWANRTVSNV
jgi:hypothetical protein